MARTSALLERVTYSPVLSRLLLYPVALAGVGFFAFTRQTPRVAYTAMRRLFCVTNGRSNDVCSRFLEHRNTTTWAPPQDGVLGRLDEAALSAIVNDLRQKGYHIFSARLPTDICRDLREATGGVPATLVPPPRSGPGQAAFDSS